jgi:hypothetical protein
MGQAPPHTPHLSGTWTLSLKQSGRNANLLSYFKQTIFENSKKKFKLLLEGERGLEIVSYDVPCHRLL